MTQKKLRDSILLTDEYIVAINKPAGILSIPDRFDPNIPHVKQLLSSIYPELWTVHRLDKDTSGIMLLARKAEAHRDLSTQFTAHQTKKIYHAIVEGQVRDSAGTITYSLAEDPRRPGKMAVSNKGKEAITHYRVIAQFGHFAEVEIKIETGRTHQIRVHLQAIGHPILADPIYGLRNSFLLSSIKGRRKYNTGKFDKEQPLLSRTALHAAQLGFVHPHTGKSIQLTAPLPKDMRAVLYQLNKLDTVK